MRLKNVILYLSTIIYDSINYYNFHYITLKGDFNYFVFFCRNKGVAKLFRANNKDVQTLPNNFKKIIINVKKKFI